MPYTLVRLARFGLPNPKADAVQGLDLLIQTERMGQMRLPYIVPKYTCIPAVI
jgi:hypothetical protein